MLPTNFQSITAVPPPFALPLTSGKRLHGLRQLGKDITHVLRQAAPGTSTLSRNEHHLGTAVSRRRGYETVWQGKGRLSSTFDVDQAISGTRFLKR